MTMEGSLRYYELKVLVFEVNGTRFAVDSEQIAAVRPGHAVSHFVPFHELVAMQPAAYDVPQLLMVKGMHAYPAILINQPEDMVDVSLQAIRPLPGLIARLANPFGVWGAVFQKQGMLILVDFYKNIRFMQQA